MCDNSQYSCVRFDSVPISQGNDDNWLKDTVHSDVRVLFSVNVVMTHQPAL